MTFIEVCTSDTSIIWHTFRVPLSRDPFIKIIINSLSIYIKSWYMHKNRALWRSIFATSAGKQLNIWPILIVQTILLDRRCTCVRESPTRSTFFHADLAGILPVDIFFSRVVIFMERHYGYLLNYQTRYLTKTDNLIILLKIHFD